MTPQSLGNFSSEYIQKIEHKSELSPKGDLRIILARTRLYGNLKLDTNLILSELESKLNPMRINLDCSSDKYFTERWKQSPSLSSF